MIKGIYGVNIAVRDLSDATQKYETFFGVRGRSLGPDSFAFPGLRGTQIDVAGFRINLIASDEPGTSVASFLEKRGEGLFLLSVEVDDIESDVSRLREMGATILMNENAEGEFGAVNFVHPKSMAGVQVEIYAPSSDYKAE